MCNRHLSRFATLGLWILTTAAGAYPLDGYDSAGIGRLEWARRVQAGEIEAARQPPGALLPLAAVDVRLAERPALALPAPDPQLSAAIAGLPGEYAERYHIAVLDLSDPQRPLYAEHNAGALQNPGSVGKLLVALALFQTLADVYPDDLQARRAVLRDTVITADDFIIRDHHTVRMWDRARERLIRRPLQVGDRGTLYEFLDFMLSASSNAAAATVMKHAMLLAHFGREYPVSEERAQEFFRDAPKAELGRLFARVMQEPVTRNGLDLQALRQGSFFTATGKRKVPGTTSYGSARELMRFLLRLEQGLLVDVFSSREIKRLLYVTERRIRYASSPALRDAAVYFKSGSLYKCEPEPDFKCLKYHGNVINYMNSAAIVEAPAGERRLHYLVALMTNVLRRNSAVDHQTLATRIHRLIEQRHAAHTAVPAPVPSAHGGDAP